VSLARQAAPTRQEVSAMTRPNHDVFFRSFESLFLTATVASSLFLTAVLAGLPALIAGL
jgi:hypothetical protein